MSRIRPLGWPHAMLVASLIVCTSACEEDPVAPDGSTSDDGGSDPDAAADDAGGAGGSDAGAADGGTTDAGGGVPDAGPPAAEGTMALVGVGNWGLRGVSADGMDWSACGNPSTGDDHSPDLLRNVGYGAGVFIAVGGDRNAMVMRSVDGVHWEEDLHPTDGCDGEPYPASCGSWMGGVAYGGGVWVAGGGNGAMMRSSDGGRTWTGLHPEPRTGAVRSIAYGSGRFVAGTGGGFVYVSDDAGESWVAHPAAEHTSRITYGAGTFIAEGRRWNGAGFDYGCAISTDAGETFTDCPSALLEAGRPVHDGARWVAPTSDGYVQSTDGVSWTAHVAEGVPDNLIYADGAWFGRSGGRVSRSEDLSSWTQLTADAPGFRAWVGGVVLDDRVPVEGVPACEDNR